MSDDKTVVEATTSQAEQVENVVKKVWTDDEVQKIISERDKTKNKLRTFEDSIKKQDELKLIEDGKLKEVLASKEIELTNLQAKATKYDSEMNKLRENALSKIEDETIREVVSKLESLDDINKLVEKQTEKIKIDNSKGILKPSERKFKNFQEMESYLKSQNLVI